MQRLYHAPGQRDVSNARRSGYQKGTEDCRWQRSDCINSWELMFRATPSHLIPPESDARHSTSVTVSCTTST